MKSLIALIFISLGVSHMSQATIYGENSLTEIQDSPESIQVLARSVGSLISKRALKNYRPTPLSNRSVCEDESFASQPSTSSCSGFLISPRHILTASHCYNGLESVCKTHAWVFDYKLSQSSSLSPENTYNCKRIVGSHYLNALDYLIVELDRPVLNRNPLQIDTEPLTNTHNVFSISSPRGLPLKYSNGFVRDNSTENHFVTTLDVMRGSSGAPVFDEATQKVVGIVASGDQDYELDEGPFCNRFKVCEEGQCRGEFATRLNLVPELKEILNTP